MRIGSQSLVLILLPMLLFGCRSNPGASTGTTAEPGTIPRENGKSQVSAQHGLIDSIKRRGGAIQVDTDDLTKPVVRADLHGMHDAGKTLNSLVPLTKLHDANLYSTGFTDADLERLRGLPKLESLNLSGTKITDAGLAVVQSLPNLHSLMLNDTSISDAGLQQLRGMTNLHD